MPTHLQNLLSSSTIFFQLKSKYLEFDKIQKNVLTDPIVGQFKVGGKQRGGFSMSKHEKGLLSTGYSVHWQTI